MVAIVGVQSREGGPVAATAQLVGRELLVAINEGPGLSPECNSVWMASP